MSGQLIVRMYWGCVAKFVLGMTISAIWQHAGLEVFRWEFWAIVILAFTAGSL